jgi:hypothetical protein
MTSLVSTEYPDCRAADDHAGHATSTGATASDDLSQIHVRLTRLQHRALRQWAFERGVSMNAAARILIGQGVAPVTPPAPGSAQTPTRSAPPPRHDQTVELATLIAVEQILLLVQTFTAEGADKAARLLTQAGDAARRRLSCAGFTEESA